MWGFAVIMHQHISVYWLKHIHNEPSSASSFRAALSTDVFVLLLFPAICDSLMIGKHKNYLNRSFVHKCTWHIFTYFINFIFNLFSSASMAQSCFSCVHYGLSQSKNVLLIASCTIWHYTLSPILSDCGHYFEQIL